MRGTIAGRLAAGLGPSRPRTRRTPHTPRPSRPPSGRGVPAPLVGIVNAAMVLMADHELASSTLAVRVAASTRSDPYATLATGLGVLSGPLHGSASRAAQQLFVEVERVGDTARVLGERARRGERVPGFGHRVYSGDDPRAVTLLHLLAELPVPPRRRDVVDDVLAVAAARVPVRPNVDLALGALAYLADLSEDALETIVALARCAGWIAHALEEHAETPLRFRALARYVGP